MGKVIITKEEIINKQLHYGPGHIPLGLAINIAANKKLQAAGFKHDRPLTSYEDPKCACYIYEWQENEETEMVR